MPKIINAYSDASGSIADSLKSLGESMFGDGAKTEVSRQQAKKGARENDAAEKLAQYYRSGDYRNAGAEALRANPGATNMGAIGLAGTALDAGKNYADPRLTTMALGAGHSFGGTVAGERENIAQRAAAAHETTTRAAATQEAIAKRQADAKQWEFDHTPEQVSQDGVITFQPRSQAMGMPTGKNVEIAAENARNAATIAGASEREHYKHDNTPYAGYDAHGNPAPVTSQAEAVKGTVFPKPLSVDEVKAKLIQRETGVSGAPAAGSPPVPGATENATPPGYVHPLVQEALGYGKGAVPYQHMQSGAIGQSYDGGRTIDGHPAGTGWVPVTSEQGVTQTRTNAQIQQAGQPLAAPPAAYPQAANDAAATSGVKAIAQHEANATSGFFGGPEIGANMNRARENLTNLANEARAVVLSAPGRAAVQSQRWANAAIPQPGALGMTGANADQQRNAVVSFTQHLRQLYTTEAQEAQDLTTNPQQRAALLSHMAQLKRIIGAYETPAAAPQGAPQQGQPAQGGKPATVVQNGFTYTLQPDGSYK